MKDVDFSRPSKRVNTARFRKCIYLHTSIDEVRRTMTNEVDEYTGCVYAAPRANEADVEWRRDASGRPFPWDLTRAQMKEMRLEGLPVRLEHVEKEKSTYDNEVGRVVDVARDPRTGYTAVKWKFHKNAAGQAARALVDMGRVGELSLGHQYFPDTSSVEAREVGRCLCLITFTV